MQYIYIYKYIYIYINLQLFLYSDSEVKRFFAPAHILSYRSARKIILYIVLLFGVSQSEDENAEGWENHL